MRTIFYWKILIGLIFCFSCSDVEQDEPIDPGPGNEVAFVFPCDTFLYSAKVVSDTIKIEGLQCSISAIYDLDTKEYIYCDDVGKDSMYCSLNWLQACLKKNILTWNLEKNDLSMKRSMRVEFCSGDYYKDIFLIQAGSE